MRFVYVFSGYLNVYLNYPGIAINKDGIIYFADGPNIRTIDEGGRIQTIIGSQDRPRQWIPLPCHRQLKKEEVGFVNLFSVICIVCVTVKHAGSYTI